MLNIYNQDFPVQVRRLAGKLHLVVHEVGKGDIVTEIAESQLPAINALRELVSKTWKPPYARS